jgi:hypothetical protein
MTDMSEPTWYACESALEIIENTAVENRTMEQLADIYWRGAIKLLRPWYWMGPENQFMDVSDAATDLFLCDAVTAHGLDIKSRDDKRELLDAEKKFVQSLHFNPHVRGHHDCKLTYRDACYFGVEAVWCESHGVEPEEVDGSALLPCLRHLFAKSSNTGVDDNTLVDMHNLFVGGEDTTALRESYINVLSVLKRRVLAGDINGGTYHVTMKMMRVNAVREGLTADEFDKICTDIELAVDYTRPRVHFAKFD